MDYVYENKCSLTDKMVEEMVWSMMPWLRPVAIAATVVVTLSAAATAFLAVVEPPADIGSVLRLCCGIVALVLIWRLPAMNTRSVMAQVRRCFGETPESLGLFGEIIESNADNNGGMEAFTYQQITKVLSLPSSYCLVIEKKHFLFLSRTGFTKGDFGSFKAFLRTKRPDLKIPE